MVKLTVDMMLKKHSSKRRNGKKEPVAQFLSSITHLYLEENEIDEIGDELAMCNNLEVVYLYENLLPCIPNLKKNENLLNLYLHNNNITKIDNLTSLKNLTKLFIGYNKLLVLEGLENCVLLKELHIENQKLDEGSFLVVDPRTINAISSTLEVLNISGNGLESLKAFQVCIYLKVLYARNNVISDIKNAVDFLNNKRCLIQLDLSENPISAQPKYRDKIIVACSALESLDNKEINAVSRKFLVNWQNSKDSMQIAAQEKNISSNNNNNSNNKILTNLHDNSIQNDSFKDATYDISYNQPAYILPAFPVSSLKKANKFRQNETKEMINNEPTDNGLNSFSIMGRPATNK